MPPSNPTPTGVLSADDIAKVRAAAGVGALPATKSSSTSLSSSLFGDSPDMETPAPDKGDGLFSRIGQDFNKRVNNAADAQIDASQGKQSKGSAVLQTLGEGAGAVADVVTEGAKSAISLLPNAKEETAALLDPKDPIVQLGMHAAKIGGDLWDTFSTAHPEAAKNLGAIFNIASIIPGAGAAEGAAKGAGKAAEGVVDATKAAKDTTARVIDATKEKVGNVVEDAQLAATKSNQIPTLENAAQKPIPFAGTDKISDPLSRYDEHVSTAQAALKDAKADTPLGQVGSRIGDAFDSVVKQRRQAGERMSSELEKIGEKPVNTSDAIGKLHQELNKNGLAIDGETGEIMRSKTSKLTESDASLLKTYAADLHALGTDPTVAELDAFLSRTPDELKVYKAKNNITGTTNGERIIKNNLAQLRTQFEPVSTGKAYLKDYAAARKQYADLSKFLDEGIPYLGKKTSAGDYAKDASIAKSSVQSVLNGGKKDWLIRLEELSGYPAIDDATLALQAMKDTGDYRGASLLESITSGAAKGELPHVPTTMTGWINTALGSAVKKGAQKLTGTPVEQTRRFLQSLKK